MYGIVNSSYVLRIPECIAIAADMKNKKKTHLLGQFAQQAIRAINTASITKIK
jgi:hypothetical protein